MTNKDIEDNIDEIFKYVGDNGYHENRGARVDCDSCKRVEKAKSRVTALILQLENEARGCVDCKKRRCENCERLWQT